VEVNESLLQALLDDVFCVFSDACEASRNAEDPLLVTLDEHFECLFISTFGGKDQRAFFILARDVRSLRRYKLSWRATPILL